MSAARGEDCGRSMMIGGSRRHAKTAPAGGSAEAVNLVGRFTPQMGGEGIWGAKTNLGLPTLISGATQNARRIPWGHPALAELFVESNPQIVCVGFASTGTYAGNTNVRIDLMTDGLTASP